MIDKMMDKVKAHHVRRFILVLVLVEIIGAFYLLMYLWRIFVQ